MFACGRLRKVGHINHGTGRESIVVRQQWKPIAGLGSNGPRGHRLGGSVGDEGDPRQDEAIQRAVIVGFAVKLELHHMFPGTQFYLPRLDPCDETQVRFRVGGDVLFPALFLEIDQLPFAVVQLP